MSTDHLIWHEKNPVPESTIKSVDPGILKKLPPGTQVVSISQSGTSYWARTARIHAVDANGQYVNYFVKILQGERGKATVSSEFESTSRLHSIMPNLMVKPVAWGIFDSIPDTYFFLCEYLELTNSLPDKSDFTARVAQFHQQPAGIAPDGMFGYPTVVWGGPKPISFPMGDRWEECFSQALQLTFAAEIVTQGRNEALEALENGIIEQVVPRLLRPLETEGRRVVPQLCHGDLWDGNVSVDQATGDPKMFDPTPVYTHYEYDMAPWRVPRHRMTEDYILEYLKHARKSEPEEDFEDRGILYSLRFDLHASSIYPGNLMFRKLATTNMVRLLEKHSEDPKHHGQRKA